MSKIWISLGLLLCYSASLNAEWHYHKFNVMGTQAAVEIWQPDQQKAKQQIQSVVDEMERINQTMSPYIATSGLSIINANAATRPVKVSQELFEILQRSIEFSRLTDGVFDISFASIGYKYDYRNKQKPQQSFIDQHLDAIDYQAIQLDRQKRSVKFNKAKTKIDLGGIAKGLAVDNAIAILQRQGIKHAFVQAGGDSRVLGDRRGRLWNIGIQHPRKEDEVITKIPLENVAVSTSGDYERFYIEDGERIHHIIDPKTGKSSYSSLSVTVIAENSTKADALSTSVFILGAEKGLELINSLEDVSAIIIDNKGKFHFSNDLVSQ
ncbi:MAG: FAD:protein FMN transferase [Kangiellaceae bacterium]|jgi:thiamine biosynthesis lipoprotein|nr:FAD:protein FMN transferase [Kangiellaceae bacterium]